MKKLFRKLRFLPVALCLIGSLSVKAQTSTASAEGKPGRDIIAKPDYSDDWAQLRKYATENTMLSAKDSTDRIVFLGSSIFEFWKEKMPEYFTSHPGYVDRGISGQISGQLLIRFQQDVIALHPKAVVILAGSNDLSGGHGHVTIERILDNVRSMVELAQLHGIRPVICLYLPIGKYPWREELPALELISQLNASLLKYARENNLPVIDYFTPLSDGHGAQRAEWTTDGVHPNKAGYEVMARVTDAVLNKL